MKTGMSSPTPPVAGKTTVPDGTGPVPDGTTVQDTVPPSPVGGWSGPSVTADEGGLYGVSTIARRLDER